MKDLKDELTKITKKQFPGARIVVDLKPVLTPSFHIEDGVLKVMLHGYEGMDKAVKKEARKQNLKCICGKSTSDYNGLLAHMVTDRVPPALQMKPLCRECFSEVQECLKKAKDKNKRIVKLKIRRK